MTAIEQYFPVVLFIVLCKVLLTFESVDVILKCHHLDEVTVVLFIMLNMVFQNNFVCGRNPKV